MCADDCCRGTVAWNNSRQHFYTKLKLYLKSKCSGFYVNGIWHSKFVVFSYTTRRVYRYEGIANFYKFYLNVRFFCTRTSSWCVYELAAQTCSTWTWSLRQTINMMSLTYLLFIWLYIWTFIKLLLAHKHWLPCVRKRLKTKTSSRWNSEYRLLRWV